MTGSGIEPTEPPSVLDALDGFTGLVALVITMTIAADLYLCLAAGKLVGGIAPLCLLPTALSMWRRVVLGDAHRRLPPRWCGVIAVYFAAILAFELIHRPATWLAWVTVAITALFVGMSVRQAVPR